MSCKRLQGALSDLFVLRLSQGGLMNLLRRVQGRFESGREAAVATLRQAEMVASDETGVRDEGSNASRWVFRSPEAVLHHAAPTRAAAVVRTVVDGHRPALWRSDRYAAQQTCLAHLARDVRPTPVQPNSRLHRCLRLDIAYAVEVSDDPVALALADPVELGLCPLRRGR